MINLFFSLLEVPKVLSVNLFEVKFEFGSGFCLSNFFNNTSHQILKQSSARTVMYKRLGVCLHNRRNRGNRNSAEEQCRSHILFAGLDRLGLRTLPLGVGNFSLRSGLQDIYQDEPSVSSAYKLFELQILVHLSQSARCHNNRVSLLCTR